MRNLERHHSRREEDRAIQETLDEFQQDLEELEFIFEDLYGDDAGEYMPLCPNKECHDLFCIGCSQKDYDYIYDYDPLEFSF